MHALWHSDFHEGSRPVVDEHGQWHRPVLLGFLDDCSRIACHLQWYLHQDTQSFVHGLCQALLKRGLCRSLLTDNGSPMMAAEVDEGRSVLSIEHHTTLPYCPVLSSVALTRWAMMGIRGVAQLDDPMMGIPRRFGGGQPQVVVLAP